MYDQIEELKIATHVLNVAIQTGANQMIIDYLRRVVSKLTPKTSISFIEKVTRYVAPLPNTPMWV